MRKSSMVLWGVVPVVVACAGGAAPGPATSSPEPSASRARSRSDLITREEMEDPALTGADALTVIRRLRPQFLMTRGPSSANTPDAGSVHVSVNNGPLLALDVLTTLRIEEIAEIRYLDAVSATQRFGSVSKAGAVIMIRRR